VPRTPPHRPDIIVQTFLDTLNRGEQLTRRAVLQEEVTVGETTLYHYALHGMRPAGIPQQAYYVQKAVFHASGIGQLYGVIKDAQLKCAQQLHQHAGSHVPEAILARENLEQAVNGSFDRGIIIKAFAFGVFSNYTKVQRMSAVSTWRQDFLAIPGHHLRFKPPRAAPILYLNPETVCVTSFYIHNRGLADMEQYTAARTSGGRR
jgi:hypothetical protein